ncbi:MAG: polysaccharide deacetylase family protein [Solirubrobacteraceae bacterium]
MTEAFPVFLYHAVTDDPLPGHERWAVSPARFAAHLDVICAAYRTPMTIGELANGMRTGVLPAAPVAISFDDGFADNLAAVRALDARGMRSTVYVTTGFIGRPAMLDVGQLGELAAIPSAQIGAHTVDHPHLDEIPRADARREIADSRERLESLLGRSVETFAYPHGAYDGRVRAEVIAHGFTSAAAVKNALTHPADDPFAIARWTVEAGTQTADIQRVLDGVRVPTSSRRTRLRTHGYRGFRRLRRRLRAAG